MILYYVILYGYMYIYIYYNVCMYIYIYIIVYEVKHNMTKPRNLTAPPLRPATTASPTDFRRVPRSFGIPAGRATFVMSCWFTSL